MSVPMDHNDKKTGEDSQPTISQNGITNNVTKIRTVKVSNVSLSASEGDVREFFNFSGQIHFIEMQRESETTQLAYVTFKDSDGADTAMLLSGAVMYNLSVSITLAEDYQLPPNAPPLNAPSAMDKAEELASTVLAKGFIIGKDAFKTVKSFDERHQLTSNASAAVASVDRKMGITDKLTLGAVVVTEKARDVNDRYQVSEKAKVAATAAEQKASTAGSALAGNRYVSVGTSWVSAAFTSVARRAGAVSALTMEKVKKAEEERWENLSKERAANVNGLAQVHLDQSTLGDVHDHDKASDSSPDSSKSDHAGGNKKLD